VNSETPPPAPAAEVRVEPQPLCEHAGRAEAEWSQLSGCGRVQSGVSAADGDRDGEEAVAVGCGEDGRGDAATGPQCPVHPDEGTWLVGQVHQSDAGDHGVEPGLFDVELFGVELADLDGGETSGGGRFGGVAEDGRGDIGDQYPAGRADAACGGQRLATCSGGHVEDGGAGVDASGVEHQRGRLAEPVLQGRGPGVPCGGGLVPLLTGCVCRRRRCGSLPRA